MVLLKSHKLLFVFDVLQNMDYWEIKSDKEKKLWLQAFYFLALQR